MLHKLIEQNDLFLNGQECPVLSYEKIYPYLESLVTYYTDQFGCEPVLMVSTITNNFVGGYIVPVDELTEIILNTYEDDEQERVMYESKMLKDL